MEEGCGENEQKKNASEEQCRPALHHFRDGLQQEFRIVTHRNDEADNRAEDIQCQRIRGKE